MYYVGYFLVFGLVCRYVLNCFIFVVVSKSWVVFLLDRDNLRFRNLRFF